jgi:DNA-binding NarL/FixJ family response regulator
VLVGDARIRLLIAEDDYLVREGARAVLEAHPRLEVLGTAASPSGLLALLDAAVPDVVILDIRMPPTHTDEGLQAAATVHDQWPNVGVLVLSQYVEADYAIGLISGGSGGLGGSGYLLKDHVTGAGALANAVRRVGGGESVIDPTLVSTLMNNRHRRDPLERLTDRERVVLTHMAEGRSNEAIARETGVTRKTVESHVSNIFMKLDLDVTPDDNRRVLAVLAYLRDGTTGSETGR